MARWATFVLFSPVAKSGAAALLVGVGVGGIEGPGVTVGARPEGAVGALPVLVAGAKVVVVALAVAAAKGKEGDRERRKKSQGDPGRARRAPGPRGVQRPGEQVNRSHADADARE